MNNRQPKLPKHGRDAIPDWAKVLNAKLDRIMRILEIIMSLESDALDELEAATTAIDGVGESAEAAFIRLAEMIAALKVNTTDPATAARIVAVSAALKSHAGTLAAAVEATPT